MGDGDYAMFSNLENIKAIGLSTAQTSQWYQSNAKRGGKKASRGGEKEVGRSSEEDGAEKSSDGDGRELERFVVGRIRKSVRHQRSLTQCCWP